MILETVTVLERLVVESIRTGAAVDGSIVPEGERLI